MSKASRRTLIRLCLLTAVVLVLGLPLIRMIGSTAAEAVQQASYPRGGLGTGDGLGERFERELERVGQISADRFSDQFGGDLQYHGKLSWDPTTATFFDRFSLDPTDGSAKVRARGDEEKMLREQFRKSGQPVPDGEPVMVAPHGGYDFRLRSPELVKFQENGFVVSERMGARSCTELYYRLYKRDLPVLITSDAILHAWHRSYDALLDDVEASVLIPFLDDVLTGMAAEIPAAHAQYGTGLWSDSVGDADYFLSVARSLLAGEQAATTLDQDERVARTLAACGTQKLERFILFGKERMVDFSQFKPRGRYERSDRLKRYFQAMMWCGRIDLRVAGNPKESSPRELASAVTLSDLLQRSGKFERWSQFDRVLTTFVGKPDSMNFAELGAVLTAASVRSPADLDSEQEAVALQQRIEASGFGTQEIRGDFFYADPDLPGRLVLPKSFAILGQRFVADSWVLSKLVYDDIHWDEKTVMRRVPSCLDVSFAVFGNDATVPLLVARMKDSSGRPFRDGLNYQHNLAAARAVIDARAGSTARENLYVGWLGALRELSRPTTGKDYPAAMRTEAWAMKNLNTQQASWAQLRHDTVLYAKQSYSGVPLCYYPAGYVEPLPRFWGQMEQMTSQAAELLDGLPHPSLKEKPRQIKFLQNFSSTMKTLRGIAEKELAQQDLSQAETKFLEDVIETKHEMAGSGSKMRFEGWYPALFYGGGEDSARWDALVADVHTDPPAPVVDDPGAVVHEAVGNVEFLLLAVDNGKDRMVYAGPVLSHYEFELSGISRHSDSEWRKALQTGRAPARPAWVSTYHVPGKNEEVPGYGDDERPSLPLNRRTDRR
jgi:hypothetical protein